MNEILINNVLQSSLIGGIGILLIAILRKTILNKYTKTFTYYVWLVVISKMIIPFRVPIYISKTVYNNFFNSSKIVNNYQYTLLYYTHNKDLYFFQIVFFLWLIGAIAIGFYHIYNYLNFTNKVKYLAYDISDNIINTLYSKLLCELNIKQNISLKYCKGIESPLGMGIFRPVILLPINTYNIEELKWILKHELLHFKKHDLYYKMLTLLTVTIHWFNPLVYIMWKMINYDCELACDETLLKNSNVESRKLYAMIFVKSLRINRKGTFTTSVMTGFSNNQNILKRRVENMLNLKSKKKGVVVGVLVAAIALTSFTSIKTFADNKAINKSSIAIKNADESNNTTTGSLLNYKGLAKNVPQKYIFNSKIKEVIKNNPNQEIVIMGSEVKK